MSEIINDTTASSWNYVDSLRNTAQREYYSMQCDSAIQQYGRVAYIFKLDKKITDKSSVYDEAKHGRVYLPHFEQRALYKSQQWAGELNLNVYEEKEQPSEFTFSFSRMVNNLRELKEKKAGKLTISNKNDYDVNFIIENGKLVIKSDTAVIIEKKLSDYSSIKLMIDSILSNTTSNISISYAGDSEKAENLYPVNIKLMSGHTKYIDVKDRLYENCSDVIELGDIIMNDKFKLYTVDSAFPSDDGVNDYITWTVKGELMDLAIVDSLPNDYRAIINKNKYGLPKVDME